MTWNAPDCLYSEKANLIIIYITSQNGWDQSKCFISLKFLSYWEKSAEISFYLAVKVWKINNKAC